MMRREGGRGRARLGRPGGVSGLSSTSWEQLGWPGLDPTARVWGGIAFLLGQGAGYLVRDPWG